MEYKIISGTILNIKKYCFIKDDIIKHFSLNNNDLFEFICVLVKLVINSKLKQKTNKINKNKQILIYNLITKLF